MRPGLLVFVLLSSVASAAEDARVTFLSRQLASTRDPRVRAQTVLLLGQTRSAAATPPLCEALKDVEPVVRTAAAGALGELGDDAAVACLRAHQAEPDAAVRAAVTRALAAGAAGPAAGGLYVSLEPVQDKVGGLPAAVVELAEKVMRDKLTALGASFAPAGEDKKSAAALIRAKKLKGYLLRMQLLPGASEKGLKVEMLVMTYPEQALKGTWNVKASGGKQESLIKAMVPRVVDDAANDLEWKN